MAGRGRRDADDVLAGLLAAGNQVKDAAARAGVGERTAFRRLKDPAFAARVRDLRAAAVSAALGRLTDGMTAAADALTALVADPSPDVRFKAAAKVIELALKVRDQADLEDRLARVEDQLRGGAGDAADRDQTAAGGGDGGGPGGPG